jgi:hypothetical protein
MYACIATNLVSFASPMEFNQKLLVILVAKALSPAFDQQNGGRSFCQLFGGHWIKEGSLETP